MATRRSRLALALAILAAWVAVTVGVGHATRPGDAAMTEAVSGGLGWNFAAAAAFLLLLQPSLRWERLGLGAPDAPWLRHLWLPAVYIVLMAVALAALGLPEPAVVGWVAINALLVGYSEELMFRGFLWRGARSALGYWSAIGVVVVLFGLVHVLNALTTGALGLAMLQACAAAMSGVYFLGLRLRSGSIWPAVAVHAVWDWVTLLILIASMTRVAAEGGGSQTLEEALAEGLDPAAMLVPLLVVLPMGLYGMHLLRGELARGR